MRRKEIDKLSLVYMCRANHDAYRGVGLTLLIRRPERSSDSSVMHAFCRKLSEIDLHARRCDCSRRRLV
jgi:hypothetical protein